MIGRPEPSTNETETSREVGAWFITGTHNVDMPLSELVVVSVDHPCLDRDVERFLDDLRSEPRYFGPTARTNPKPFPSLVGLLQRRTGIRLGVVECGRLIGLGRVDRAGQVFLAIAADRRGQGVGSTLVRSVIERAIAHGYSRLTIRTTERSRVVQRIGNSLGCTVVSYEHGRIDLIIDLANRARSA